MESRRRPKIRIKLKRVELNRAFVIWMLLSMDYGYDSEASQPIEHRKGGSRMIRLLDGSVPPALSRASVENHSSNQANGVFFL